MPLGISVALTFPSAMMASYYLLLQTYVLRLEAIMNGILLVFCGSELLLEVLTLAAFSRYASRHLRVGFPSHPREGLTVLLKPEESRELLRGKAVPVGLPFPFRVDSYPLREDILLVLWGQEAWGIQQFRSLLLLTGLLTFCFFLSAISVDRI